jgi:sporulation protein YlmC with PRC-barrel domain
MPRPDVNVAMAQPQVEVRQPEPRVEVVQPAQPQVQVAPAQAQVQVQQAQGQPNVQIQGAEGQAQVRYERAEPRVVVNQAQGQPNVRFEGQEAQASPGAAATAQVEPRAPVVAAPPATTGAVPGSSATSNVRQLSVTQLEDMNVYNAQGNQLGEVDDVLIGPNNAVHLVVGYGGFLGLGERKVLLPLDRFQMQNDRLVVQGMSEDQLRALPAHSRMGEGFRSAENAFQAPIGLAR